MKKLFLFILLLVFGFFSWGQTGVPGNGNSITVYVEKVGNFNLRVGDRRTYSQQVNLTYSSGVRRNNCEVIDVVLNRGINGGGFAITMPRQTSNSVRSVSCGNYTITYTRPFSVTVPSGHNIGVPYGINYTRNTPSYRNSTTTSRTSGTSCGMITFGGSQGPRLGQTSSGPVITVTGSCNGSYVSSSTVASIYPAVRAWVYPFSHKGNKSIVLSGSGGTINLKSSTYWSRTSLPVNYGSMTFKVGTIAGDNSYGVSLNEGTGSLDLGCLFDRIPIPSNNSDNRSAVVTATLPYYNGNVSKSFTLSLAGSSYSFKSKGNKSVSLTSSGGTVDLRSTNYWNTVNRGHGNISIKVGSSVGNNNYGGALSGGRTLNLGNLYDRLSGGDDRNVTITATLPLCSGSVSKSFVFTLRGASYRFKSKGTKTMCAVGSVNLRSGTYWNRFSSNNFVPSNASVAFTLSDSRASSALTGYTLNLANLYGLLPNTNSGDRGVTVSARLSYSGINVDASFLLTLQGIPLFSIPNNSFVNANIVNNKQTYCNNSGSKVISTLSNVTWSGSHVSNNRFNTNTASNSSYTLTATRSRTGTGGCVVRRTVTTNVSVITPSVNLFSGNVLKYCDYNSDVNLGMIQGTPGGGSFSYPANSANKSLVVSNEWIRISSTGAGTYPIVYTKEINGCVGSARQDIVINPRPAIPSIVNVANHERCGPGNITLAVSHSESGNYIWKNSSNSVFSGATSNTYQQNYDGGTTVRKVSFKKASTGCQSLERSLQAKVKPIPTPPTLSQTNSVCGNGVVNLRASHSNSNVSFKWYTTLSGVSSFRSASTYSTPTIIPYYVSAVLEGCPSSRAVINAFENPIPGTPDVDNSLNFACSTSDVLTLSVRGALANESYRWYANSAGWGEYSQYQSTYFIL